MTPEQRLILALPELRALIDSLAGRSPSEARDLLRLDLLVRRYPAAARASLNLRRRIVAEGPEPPGWCRVSGTDGLPVWLWRAGSVHVATEDMDQLRYLGVALARFDRMSADELHAYLRG
jgi:hypothetical protein